MFASGNTNPGRCLGLESDQFYDNVPSSKAAELGPCLVPAWRAFMAYLIKLKVGSRLQFAKGRF